MSFLITAPERLASTAADVERIGSAIGAANADAAGPTTGVVAAAEDEVSAAIAKLFGFYGQEYQAVINQAVAFHSQFTQALAAAGNAYTQAEAANASLAASAASADPLTALIIGYTSDPQPDPNYVASIYNSFIQPRFPTALPQGLFTPEQFWPVTPGLGNLTFGESVAQGVTLLNNAITAQLSNPADSILVFGYSQSATIATNEINALMAIGAPHANQLSFMLVGDPNNPVGGILERFPGFYIPFLDVAFNGATPPNSPYPTTIYTAQYDGIADLPQYPLNVISDLNAVMGYFFVHDQYPLMTATQVANAVALPTSPGYTGNTQYYMLMTQNLPLLEPIRDIPYIGPPIADIFQPDLRVLVDLGYADYGPGENYANVPTPSGLFSVADPFTVIPDLALGAVQGPYGAAVEVGVEAGLVSPSLFPDTYPWAPSVDPHLNFFLGQPSVTGLSELSGLVGNVLKIIPPVLN